MHAILHTQKTFITNLFIVSFSLFLNLMMTRPAQAYSSQRIYEMSISKSIFDHISSMGKSFLSDFFQDADGYNQARVSAEGELVVFCDKGDKILIRVSEKSARVWLGLMNDFSNSIFVDDDTRQVMLYMRDKFFNIQGGRQQLVKG